MSSDDDSTTSEIQTMSTPDVTQASTVGKISYGHYLPDVVKEWITRAGFELDNQTILFAAILMILIVILMTSICVIACYCCWTEIGIKRRRKCKKKLSSMIQDEDIESDTNNDQYYKNIMGGRNIKSISQYAPVRNNKYHDDKGKNDKDEDKDKTSEADNYYNQIMKNKKVTPISEYRKN